MVLGSPIGRDSYDGPLLRAGFCTLYSYSALEAYRIVSQVVLSAIVTELDLDIEECRDERTPRLTTGVPFDHLPIVFIGSHPTSVDTDRPVVQLPKRCSPDGLAAVITAILSVPPAEALGRQFDIA